MTADDMLLDDEQAPAEEVLDPGPDIRGEHEFVEMHHPQLEGTMRCPAHLVDHWTTRGWIDPTAPVQITEEGDLVDDDLEALAGLSKAALKKLADLTDEQRAELAALTTPHPED